MPDGVVDEIAEDPGDVRWRELELWSPPVHLALDPDAPGVGRGRGGGDRVGDEVGERRALHLEPKGSRVDHRQLEQLVDEFGQPLGLDAQRPVVAVQGGAVLDQAVLERLGHGP